MCRFIRISIVYFVGKGMEDMKRKLKSVLKAILPPILIDILRSLRKGKFYGLSGDFVSWPEAEEYVAREYGRGYAANNILEQVLAAIQEVRSGRAVFERDGCLFYEQEYNYPFLAALFYSLNDCLSTRGGHADILDFGGSLGSTYFQNRKLLVPFSGRWHIVEQPHFVQTGRANVPEITFHESVEAYMENGESTDVLLLSGVLQYFDPPYVYLERIMRGRFKYILVDRGFFNEKDLNNDRLTIQTVPPSIYRGAYPAWLLSLDKVRREIEQAGYKEIMQWESIDRMLVKEADGECWTLPSRGFLMERQA